ncbi:hypothetical protein DCD77_20115, partial [Acinetobacter baumannii]
KQLIHLPLMYYEVENSFRRGRPCKTDAPERHGHVTERRCQTDETVIRTLVTSDDFLAGLM